MAVSYCPRCGQGIPPGARFCGRCGAPAGAPLPAPATAGPGALPPAGPGGYFAAPPPPPPNHRPLYILLAIGVVVAVVLVVLLVVPVAHPFSTTLASSSDAPATDFIVFPSGAPVHGSWSSDGGSVEFQVLGFGHSLAENGTSGSFSFTATLAFVEFEVTSSGPATVSVSGSYSSPLL